MRLRGLSAQRTNIVGVEKPRVAKPTTNRGAVATVPRQAVRAAKQETNIAVVPLRDAARVAYLEARNGNVVQARRILKSTQPATPAEKAHIRLIEAWLGEVESRSTQPSTELFQFDDEAADAETNGLATYMTAVSAWFRGRIDAAESSAARIPLDLTPWLAGLAMELRGWIDIRQQRYSPASRRFLEAIRALDRTGMDDRLRLNALFGLALVAVETLDLEFLPLLRDEVSKQGRIPGAERAHAFLLSYVAIGIQLTSLLDESTLHSMLLEARNMSLPHAFAAFPILELHDFHAAAGELRTAKLYVQEARQVLLAVDWSLADIEERVLLLAVATRLAAYDYSSAANALMQAASYRGKKDARLAFEHDGRAQAYAWYASALLAHHDGKIVFAQEEMNRAVSAWSAVGYRFRAAEAESYLKTWSEALTIRTPHLDAAMRDAPGIASRLCRIEQSPADTGSSRLQKQIKQKSTIRPNRATHEQSTRNDEVSLGPAESRVCDLICEGLTGREIAHEVGRSLSTVKNQTIRIFRSYGVNDRGSLVAKIRALATPEDGVVNARNQPRIPPPT